MSFSDICSTKDGCSFLVLSTSSVRSHEVPAHIQDDSWYKPFGMAFRVEAQK